MNLIRREGRQWLTIRGVEQLMTPARVIAALALCFALGAASGYPPRRSGPARGTARLVVVELSPRGWSTAAADDPPENAPLFCTQPCAVESDLESDRRGLLPLVLVLVDRSGGGPRVETAWSGLLCSAGGRGPGDPSAPRAFAMALPGGRALVAVRFRGLSWAVLGPGDSWGEVVRGRGVPEVVVRATNAGRALVEEPDDRRKE